MYDYELAKYFVGYGYFVICMSLMGVGVMVVRGSADFEALRKNLSWAGPLFAFTLFGCAVGTHFYGPVGCLYVLGLYASFCSGVVLDIAESSSEFFKAKVKDAAVESARQWGKVPSSH
jgi:hypothetical protein